MGREGVDGERIDKLGEEGVRLEGWGKWEDGGGRGRRGAARHHCQRV